MTLTRPIDADELPLFVAAATSPDHRGHISRYVHQMFDRGAMRPEWCYIAESGGEASGRIGLWTLPPLRYPIAFVLWDAASPDTARELLDRAISDATALGSRALEYVIDDPPQPPQWQVGLSERLARLDGRFQLRRVTARFELTGDVTDGARSPSLHFRSLAASDEGQFVVAIERVSAGSLDRHTIAERERLGPAAEARQTFHDLRQLQFEPAWWELAFDASGTLVGLVMPCANPTTGTIGYIGVVPEMRGRGYVDALLRRGTETLRRSGHVRIQADSDIANAPMRNAFLRAGYRQFATRREYLLRLLPATEA